MAYLRERLALLPLPSLLLMVLGALLVWNAQALAIRLFPGHEGRDIVFKWVGLGLFIVGTIWVFV